MHMYYVQFTNLQILEIATAYNISMILLKQTTPTPHPDFVNPTGFISPSSSPSTKENKEIRRCMPFHHKKLVVLTGFFGEARRIMTISIIPKKVDFSGMSSTDSKKMDLKEQLTTVFIFFFSASDVRETTLVIETNRKCKQNGRQHRFWFLLRHSICRFPTFPTPLQI